jgi:cyclic pyranopterin phosphate synthase
MSGEEKEAGEWTHLDASGRARMVDVGRKDITERRAVARALLQMQPATRGRVRAGGIAKGDVLAVAQVAAVMAVKKTADLIPLCHPLSVSGVEVAFADVGEDRLAIDVTVSAAGRTGVEMEALTGAVAGALTVYDMCKAVDRGMAIVFTGLMEKSGGKSGHYVRAQNLAAPGIQGDTT